MAIAEVAEFTRYYPKYGYMLYHCSFSNLFPYRIGSIAPSLGVYAAYTGHQMRTCSTLDHTLQCQAQLQSKSVLLVMVSAIAIISLMPTTCWDMLTSLF